MVNILKRMRGLQPLFAIRHGEGAAILPRPPLPQLTRLNLQYDRQQWNKSTRPARILHKEHLPRLKYHNPALPIRVEQGPARLQLTFESANKDALNELETTSLGSSVDGEFRATWTTIEPKSNPANAPSTPSPSSADSTLTTIEPETNTADAPSTSSPSSANSIFIRSVELKLGPHQPKSLWHWFQTTTQCEAFPENPEETEQMDRLNEFFAKAEIDRQRVKAGMDDVRKQKEELLKAREAAARMANEE